MAVANENVDAFKNRKKKRDFRYNRKLKRRN